MELNAENVEKIFGECETTADAPDVIAVMGVVHKAAFDPGAIADHQDEIHDLLKELPMAFRQSIGGGMSFLNACNDWRGIQWTSFHMRMEQLFQLGLAAGMVKEVLPRELWGALPGGMPYYVITGQ